MRDKLAGIIAGTTNCPTDAAFRAADAIITAMREGRVEVGWAVNSCGSGWCTHDMESRDRAEWQAKQYGGEIARVYVFPEEATVIQPRCKCQPDPMDGSGPITCEVHQVTRLPEWRK